MQEMLFHFDFTGEGLELRDGVRLRRDSALWTSQSADTELDSGDF